MTGYWQGQKKSYQFKAGHWAAEWFAKYQKVRHSGTDCRNPVAMDGNYKAYN